VARTIATFARGDGLKLGPIMVPGNTMVTPWWFNHFNRYIGDSNGNMMMGYIHIYIIIYIYIVVLITRLNGICRTHWDEHDDLMLV
jgi:hypothetical protein